MCYDYSLLRGRIVEKFGNNYTFAYMMGMSERSLSVKLNNKRKWNQQEMEKACELLDLDLSEIPAYFFNCKVQSN